MNNLIKRWKEDQIYPCLIFFLAKNSKFGKTFTLDDVSKPSREAYYYAQSNLMNLGRRLPPYEEWARACMDYDLIYLQKLSTRELTVQKMAVESFEDIAKAKSVCGFVRYLSNELNEYFGVDS